MQHQNKAFLYFICAVSAMGGLLFGYDWVVIGGAKPFYELFFGITESPVMQGVAMSTALVGCLFGAMVAGAAADRWGRKPLLTMSAVLFTVSAIGTGLFDDFTLFNIARFVGGMGIGVASALAPMYIAEVSPAEIRGRMVSLNQMTIVLGILAAQIVNMLLARDTSIAESQVWNVQWGWRWMFWAETLPAALFLVMSLFIPESPVFLKAHPSPPKGRDVWLHKSTSTSNQTSLPLGGLGEATASTSNQTSLPLGGLGWAQYHRVLLLGLFIAVNTGIANVLFSFVALYTIERWGRRTLMLIGAGGLGLIYLTLGTCYFFEVKGVMMVVLVVTAISVYAMTLGPVTWTLLAEIFPNRIRGVAMATCTFALWVGCCTLTFSFPSMNATLGSSGTFWVYSAICLCAFIFLYRRCPETKGKSLEQLEQELAAN